MPTVKITDRNSVFVASAADTGYVLDLGEKITSLGYGIDAGAVAAGREFIVNGEIASQETGILLGQGGTADVPSLITIGETGFIHSGAANGVTFQGDFCTVVNHGSLMGNIGIYANGEGGLIRNDGHIAGQGHGIFQKIGNGLIVNSGTISGNSGVHFAIGADQQATLVNSGSISGATYGVLGTLGTQKIVNSGTIFGSVTLGDDEDIYVNKGGGQVNGTVSGGADNDLYVVNRNDLELYEAVGGGYDTVRSSVSFTLAENFDYLYLTGKADLRGTGSSGNNYLRGNAGDNRLKGMDGQDALEGGRGTDILIGGAEADGFYFRPGLDKEIVMDFVDGVDHLVLFLGKEITSIDDFLKHHAHNAGNDLVLEGDGTTMILKGMQKADLSFDDFVF